MIKAYLAVESEDGEKKAYELRLPDGDGFPHSLRALADVLEWRANKALMDLPQDQLVEVALVVRNAPLNEPAGSNLTAATSLLDETPGDLVAEMLADAVVYEIKSTAIDLFKSGSLFVAAGEDHGLQKSDRPYSDYEVVEHEPRS